MFQPCSGGIAEPRNPCVPRHDTAVADRKTAGGANLATAQAFWAEPEQFALIAGEAGLKIERDFPHQTLDKQRQPCNSLSRHNYVLRKQA